MNTKTILFFVALSCIFIASAKGGDTEKTISVSKYKTNPMHGNVLNYVSFGLKIGHTLNRSN